jgi:hypothetical protein
MEPFEASPCCVCLRRQVPTGVPSTITPTATPSFRPSPSPTATPTPAPTPGPSTEVTEDPTSAAPRWTQCRRPGLLQRSRLPVRNSLSL